MRGKEKKSARGGVGSARVEVAAARSEVGICGGMGKDCQYIGVFSPESAGFSGLFRRIDGMMWSVFPQCGFARCSRTEKADIVSCRCRSAFSGLIGAVVGLFLAGRPLFAGL